VEGEASGATSRLDFSFPLSSSLSHFFVFRLGISKSPKSTYFELYLYILCFDGTYLSSLFFKLEL
jgi:hypothetical protein